MFLEEFSATVKGGYWITFIVLRIFYHISEIMLLLVTFLILNHLLRRGAQRAGLAKNIVRWVNWVILTAIVAVAIANTVYYGMYIVKWVEYRYAARYSSRRIYSSGEALESMEHHRVRSVDLRTAYLAVYLAATIEILALALVLVISRSSSRVRVERNKIEISHPSFPWFTDLGIDHR